MSKSTDPITTKPVPVRLDPDMVRRIDDLRGLVSRERYVREVLVRPALEAAERKEARRRSIESEKKR